MCRLKTVTTVPHEDLNPHPVMHVSIMDELDTRAAASEPARMRGVADGRECIGECGQELHIERAGMWSMCGRAASAARKRTGKARLHV